MGKRTAQKDITIDTTSDSQVNSNFPNKWSPASLTFNNYFYLFLYLYITWISTNNNAPHLKSPKNQKQKSRLGTASNKNYWGLELVCGRPTLALVLPWFIRHNNYKESITLQNKTKSFKDTKHLFLPIFFCFYYYIKHDRQQSGQLHRWPQC